MTEDPVFALALGLPPVCAVLLWLQARGKMPGGLDSRLCRDFLIIILALSLPFAACELYWRLTETLLLCLFLVLPILVCALAAVFFRFNRNRRTPAGPGRLLAGNVLVLLCLLSLTLPCGEVYYRFIYDETDWAAYTKVSARWGKKHYRLNRAGFRDSIEYAPRMQPGKRRISFLGDSFTVGHGVKDVEKRFANLIRRRHPGWEIQTLARNGNDTGAEVELLDKCATDGYQLDQVVLVYCLNDISDLPGEWKRTLADVSARVRRRPEICDSSYFLDILFHRLVVARAPEVRNYGRQIEAGYRGVVWEEQRRRLQAVRDRVQSRGGRLLVVTFPFLDALGPEYPFQFAHDELAAWWKELGVPHLDLMPALKEFRPRALTVSAFDAHPNELAHSVAAEKIEGFLAEQIPPSKSTLDAGKASSPEGKAK